MTNQPPPIAGLTDVERVREWALDKAATHHSLARENEHLRAEHIASSSAYRALADEVAAILVSNRSGVEAGRANIPEPTADDFAEVGEAVEGAMLSEESWTEIGEIAWRIFSRDREVTDWSKATRGKFLDAPTINEGEG